MNFIKTIIVNIVIGISLQSALSEAKGLVAFTTNGDEVFLDDNGTWKFKKENVKAEKNVKVGVTSVEAGAGGGSCKIKFEVRNPTKLNFKSFWPKTHLVDKKGFRFASSNIQISIRPAQNTTTDVIYLGTECPDLAKIEIDSFFSCEIYEDKGKVSNLGDCETILAPIPGTKVPVVIIDTK